MNADLRKKAKIIFKNIFESWWIVVALDRPLPKEKNEKQLNNKRWIKWTNHEIICWIKSKNI